jgi:hypothetical protein
MICVVQPKLFQASRQHDHRFSDCTVSVIQILEMHESVPRDRDFVPWRFLDAGRHSAWKSSSCRRPKTCTLAHIRYFEAANCEAT